MDETVGGATVATTSSIEADVCAAMDDSLLEAIRLQQLLILFKERLKFSMKANLDCGPVMSDSE
jgi:hypothetical protein